MTTVLMRPLAACMALLLGACAGGPERPASAPITLEVKDLTPNFVAFYDAAVRTEAGPAQRWELWQEHYNFAAVPPTQEGRTQARRLLEDAWPRYAAAMRRIRAGAAGMRPSPRQTLDRVAGLLRLEQPLVATLVTYVGAFEDNAFVARLDDGRIHIALPVETEPAVRELLMAHEFAHVVHIITAGLEGGWERTIAETVMMEGLAMHTARALYPRRPPEVFTEHEPGWLRRAQQQEPAILRGLRPHLPARDSQTVHRFTIGEGSTGLSREAYYAGWRVVGRLLEQGRTLAELARIPAEDLPALVDRVIVDLLPAQSRR